MPGAIAVNNLGCPRCESAWDEVNQSVGQDYGTVVACCRNRRCRTEFAVHVSVSILGRADPRSLAFHHACGLCGSLEHLESKCEMAGASL